MDLALSGRKREHLGLIELNITNFLNVTRPRLQTDLIIGNDLIISNLPTFAITIVRYNDCTKIVFKSVFRTKLVNSARGVEVVSFGFFGLKKHRFMLPGNFVNVQLHERAGFPKSTEFKATSHQFHVSNFIVRKAEHEFKLTHQKCKISGHQVRFIHSDWNVNLPKITSSYTNN